jgi:1-deoxy-D-xylulose-5-phosphate reductoisomerase
MRTALAHALAWPERIDAGVAPLDIVATGRLDFEPPDRATFACLDLAYRALESGGGAAIALNAANEAAVDAFLHEKLDFLAIAQVIEATMDSVLSADVSTLAGVIDADLTARRVAQRIIASAKV